MTLEKLFHLLKTASSVKEIDSKREEIAKLIPEVRIMFDYDQKNSAHQYDLWTHCIHTVLNLPRDLDDDMLYFAALLHDIGKPDSQCKGKREDDTEMHYYGHPEKSLKIVRDDVIYGLLKNNVLHINDVERLLYYVQYHDDRVSLRVKHLRRHMKLVSFEDFQKLMLLQIADAKAHVQIPVIAERVKICEALAGKYGKDLYHKWFVENKENKKIIER